MFCSRNLAGSNGNHNSKELTQVHTKLEYFADRDMRSLTECYLYIHRYVYKDFQIYCGIDGHTMYSDAVLCYATRWDGMGWNGMGWDRVVPISRARRHIMRYF